MSKLFQVLEFTLNINGKPARTLIDTRTMDVILISKRFVSRSNIADTARKNLVTMKISLKGF